MTKVSIPDSDSLVAVQIPLTTVTNHHYRVTVDVDLAGSIGVAFLARNPWNGAQLGYKAVNSNGTYTLVFTAGNVNSLIMFQNGNATPRDIYLDNFKIEDITDGVYAERLNGSANEKYGVARWVNVAPGDVVSAEVYAKYVDTVSAAPDIAFRSLPGQISGHFAGVVTDGSEYSTSTLRFNLLVLAIRTAARVLVRRHT